MPRISIIIPTYNHSEYIGAAIDSVLAQTFKDWELIIVNNYSTDDTEEKVKAYKDSRICLVNYSNDGIVARSRNYGISLAHGELLAFLDSDDIWLPQKLAVQVAALMRNSDLLGVCSAMRLFPGEVRTPLVKILSHRLTYHSQLFRNKVYNSSVMIRREAWRLVGTLNDNPRLRTIEDYEYWLRILRLRNRSILFQDQVLVRYRVSHGNLSGIGRAKDINSEIDRFDFLMSLQPSKYHQIVLKFRRKEIDAINYYLARRGQGGIIGKFWFAVSNSLRQFWYRSISR